MAGGGGGFLWLYGTLFPISILASTKSPSTWPLLLTAAIPIWCGDTAAIFVGKAFGKHKLAPEISPNKTWEGAIGNLIACVCAALALGAIFHYQMLLMVLLGLNCGIIGQAGDLFESWLKRKADVKDSGNILPGHGGLLDRLDSLMATAPISLLILQSLVVPGTPN
jgi:phosphatidate cytidylyltransferase